MLVAPTCRAEVLTKAEALSEGGSAPNRSFFAMRHALWCSPEDKKGEVRSWCLLLSSSAYCLLHTPYFSESAANKSCQAFVVSVNPVKLLPILFMVFCSCFSSTGGG